MSPLFPGDPSDEELARDWTLSPDDLDEIQEHTQRIREHLGFEPFSDDASTRLAQSLEQNARQGVTAARPS